MKTINRFFAVLVLILASGSAFAQDEINVPEIDNEQNGNVNPFHISFITPFGTNGTNSWKITNVFSLNMFAGCSGGLNGAEIGGFYNILKGNMTGIQIAGFGNTDMGTTTGGQIAGFCNINRKFLSGVQIAGFTNIVTDSITAAQLSGFVNYANGSVKGLQTAGFANVSKGSLTGGQVSGFAAFAHGRVHGAQVSGFINMSTGMLHGMQVAGFANISKGDSEGGQLGGFINVNTGNMKGGQIAGFANITTKDIKGVQLAGFFNMARKVTGAQIGVINIADTIDKGISFGILSFVRKGYRAFEISGNESLYSTARFKTGTEYFYNIIAVGTSLSKNRLTWGYGYGIGTLVPVTGRINMNIDAVAWQINKDRWQTIHFNMVNKVNVCASVQLSEKFYVFGGMTWNVQVSDIYENDGTEADVNLVRWSVYDRDNRNGTTNVKMYPGFVFGVRIQN
ncbi:MAG: hypothetical protein KJ607_02725 [Bacteroidetes bacterium]|nr:hypothetical protein [Bacteroidota bacterium]